jgi:hypothetical protein
MLVLEGMHLQSFFREIIALSPDVLASRRVEHLAVRQNTVIIIKDIYQVEERYKALREVLLKHKVGDLLLLLYAKSTYFSPFVDFLSWLHTSDACIRVPYHPSCRRG